MTLRTVFDRVLRSISEQADEMPHSMVLLQRETHYFEAPELQLASERGWGRRFDGNTDPAYCVVQNGGFTMIKTGPYLVNMRQVKQPYFGDCKIDLDIWLPLPEQKTAFLAHRGWVAIDLYSSECKPDEAYAVLARFALQLGDANCSAVYVPKKRLFMPNNGAAEEGLRRFMEGWEGQSSGSHRNALTR
jgi:hypothetical protein